MKTAGTALELRQDLLSRLNQSRATTDALFARVRGEALYDRPIPERHRIVFYIGHLEAFDWNLIVRRATGLDSFSPELDQLFAFGIDPTDGGLPTDVPGDWPSLERVHAYNRRVRETVDRLLSETDFSDPGRPLFRDGLVAHVAIEHRLMHAETLAYMFHQLPYDRKLPLSDPPPPAGRPAPGHTIRVPAGTATLGLARRDEGEFGWDNEFEPHPAQVPGFSIGVNKVTNGEFLEFVRAGGYREPALWSAADWTWRSEQGLEHPAFWRRDSGGVWLYRGMFSERPLPLDWPVYVSHAEASAFARWTGKALPTEAQFHRAAYGTPGRAERPYPWGEARPDARRGNFDFARWDPTPVGAYPDGDSAFGARDMLGNGYEWTSTPFGPFTGFQAFPFYPGYSANFFDGKHYVMKGGSPRTAACLLRRSFRNWFQSHYSYMYAGFRCVEN